jgi:hypothetical protein
MFGMLCCLHSQLPHLLVLGPLSLSLPRLCPLLLLLLSLFFPHCLQRSSLLVQPVPTPLECGAALSAMQEFTPEPLHLV